MAAPSASASGFAGANAIRGLGATAVAFGADSGAGADGGLRGRVTTLLGGSFVEYAAISERGAACRTFQVRSPTVAPTSKVAAMDKALQVHLKDA